MAVRLQSHGNGDYEKHTPRNPRTLSSIASAPTGLLSAAGLVCKLFSFPLSALLPTPLNCFAAGCSLCFPGVHTQVTFQQETSIHTDGETKTKQGSAIGKHCRGQGEPGPFTPACGRGDQAARLEKGALASRNVNMNLSHNAVRALKHLSQRNENLRRVKIGAQVFTVAYLNH